MVGEGGLEWEHMWGGEESGVEPDPEQQGAGEGRELEQDRTQRGQG